MDIWQDLGVSAGTAIIVLVALFFTVKWAVKSGVKGALKDIADEESAAEVPPEKILDDAAQGCNTDK